MNCAVIDVGSNTIRTVIYSITESGYTDIYNDREYLGLISYVEDDTLQDAGYEKLVSVLRRMSDACKEHQCSEVHCIATASMRTLKKSDDLILNIKKDTGLEINIITGEEEAVLDFAGLKSVSGNTSGIGFDLGGGSCQIFLYENDSLTYHSSFPIGSLKMYNSFVSGDIPTQNEQENIRTFVKDKLNGQDTICHTEFSDIYAIGGTVNAVLKLKSILFSNIPEDKNISKPLLGSILSAIYNNKHSYEFLCSCLPERAKTIIPGIIVLDEICSFTGADNIKVIKAGVREGYLYKNILKRL